MSKLVRLSNHASAVVCESRQGGCRYSEKKSELKNNWFVMYWLVSTLLIAVPQKCWMHLHGSQDRSSLQHVEGRRLTAERLEPAPMTPAAPSQSCCTGVRPRAHRAQHMLLLWSVKSWRE